MYASKAQQAFFHANKKALEKRGVNVAEWDKSTIGKLLPKRLTPTKKQSALARLKRGMMGKSK